MRFRRIKCFGLGESAIEARLPDLVRRGRDPLVGITAHEATITLRIAARGADEAECLARIAPTETVIRECLGNLVFGVEDDEVEDAALAAVAAAGGSLATIEAGTCGHVAALAAAAARRRGDDRFRGGEVLTPGAGEALWAERARHARSATHGLAVGPVEREDGGDVVEIVLVGGTAPVRVRHRLGGDATIRLPRAARTALDLVRTTCLAGAGPASAEARA
jgi:nicotinamide-nucleotide amidase